MNAAKWSVEWVSRLLARQKYLNRSYFSNTCSQLRICSARIASRDTPSRKLQVTASWMSSKELKSGSPVRTFTEEQRTRLSRLYSLFIASLIGIIGSSYMLYISNTHAKELESKNVSKDGQVSGVRSKEKEDSENDESELHKSKAGFRERKIIEYENRLRSYSTPDKVFRYFATLQDAYTSDIFMTPEDFVRSLTRDTMQPKGLGLDEFKKFDKRKHGPYLSPLFGPNSVFRALGESGLISFSDYIFLLTVLGTSARHIDIAFKMFDLNGDGEVTAEEFGKVRTLFLNMSSTGMRHRDHKTTGNVLGEEVNTGLMRFFFGVDGKEKLTVDQFVSFKRRLQKEVMQLEFNGYNPKNGKIAEKDFAEILLTYASFSEKTKVKMVKRIRKHFPRGEGQGISFTDYLNFFDFLLNIRDVDMALSFHTVAGQPIDQATFRQVAQTVSGVHLSDHLIQVVFKLFDENDDGHLSNKEFIAVMKDKMFRGLNKPKDTGLTRFMSAIFTCAGNTVSELWTSPDD